MTVDESSMMMVKMMMMTKMVVKMIVMMMMMIKMTMMMMGMMVVRMMMMMMVVVKMMVKTCAHIVPVFPTPSLPPLRYLYTTKIKIFVHKH